jgi:hypothetical protein
MECDNMPKCPYCGSENIQRVKGCRCMSCPPWICITCKKNGKIIYDFFDDDDDDDDDDEIELTKN